MRISVKYFCLLIIFLFGCKKESTIHEEEVSVYGAWQLKPSAVVNKRQYHVAGAVDGKGYIGMGFDEYAIKLNDWWQFDPVQELWTQKANSLSDGSSTMKTFSTRDKIFVVDSNRVYSYDPFVNSWLQLYNFPGIRRSRYLLVGNDSGAYLGMGSLDSMPFSNLNDWWKYEEDSDKWIRQNNFIGAGKDDPLGFLIDRKIYVGMGSFVENGVINSDYTLYEYSIESNQWNSTSTIPYQNQHGYGFTLDGKGFFVGGILPWLNHSLDQFDPSTKTWKSFYDIKFSFAAAFFIIDNKLYLFQSTQKYALDNTSNEDKFWILTP